MMKIYKGKDSCYDYLKDRGTPRSGSMWELDLEVKVWNFIAIIFNTIKKVIK